MGISISNMFVRLWRGKTELRIAMLGLDDAGKTTLLHQMKPPEVPVVAVPTIGFNVELVEMKNINLTVLDIGGSEKNRPLWKCFYYTAYAIIYVVDSSNRERLVLAKDELHRFIDCMLPESILLVFANKQDLPKAATGDEVIVALDMHNLPVQKLWKVQEACATTGVGLREGFEWLDEELNKIEIKQP